jgi:hypothetical protein
MHQEAAKGKNEDKPRGRMPFRRHPQGPKRWPNQEHGPGLFVYFVDADKVGVMRQAGSKAHGGSPAIKRAAHFNSKIFI